MGEIGKRISRMKPFGEEDRCKNHSSAFITETGKKSDARCLLRKMFINNKTHSSFPHPQQNQYAYIFSCICELNVP